MQEFTGFGKRACKKTVEIGVRISLELIGEELWVLVQQLVAISGFTEHRQQKGAVLTT
jgi:hypothetical protein